jgi:hypothetical protein
VTNILRGAGRERYDHFLNNGFPKWKGTGYYYTRFRPGLGTVLVVLFITVGGGGHWLALYMSWKRQQDFVGRYIKFARHSAWGDNLNIPGLDGVATPPVASGDDTDPMAQPMNRRQRRMQEKDAKKEKSEKKTKGIKAAKASPAATPPVGATGARKRVVAENGKILVVDSIGNVYLEQTDEDGETQEFLLDVCISFPHLFISLTYPSPMNSLNPQSEIRRSTESPSGSTTALLVVFQRRRLQTRILTLKMMNPCLAAQELMTLKSWKKSRQGHKTRTGKRLGETGRVLVGGRS